MAMLRRTYVGLEITSHELRAVAVQRRGKNTNWIGGKTLPFAQPVIQPSRQQMNIIQPELFVDAVKKILTSLTIKETRIAVALPNICGQVFILDIDTPFSNWSEGGDVIRWRLKDLLPEEFGNIALDYQVLEENEGESKKILAAVISRKVLEQYESLIELAGYSATVVDFHALSLYNSYRQQMDMGHDFILLGVDGCQLSIMVFVNQVLVFCRLRQINQNPQQIFQELNRSFVTYRNHNPAFNRLVVYLHSDWHNREELFMAVSSIFDQEVQWLLSPPSKLANKQQIDSITAEGSMNGMVVALGVAERMIKRVPV